MSKHREFVNCYAERFSWDISIGILHFLLDDNLLKINVSRTYNAPEISSFDQRSTRRGGCWKAVLVESTQTRDAYSHVVVLLVPLPDWPTLPLDHSGDTAGTSPAALTFLSDFSV